jgi:hypothetical protein
MLPRDTVPNSTRAIVHKTPIRPDGAVDIYAPPGSFVLAPGDGFVTDVQDLKPHDLPGWQIRGRIRRPDGKEVPYVLAHLTVDTHPPKGGSFRKGQVIGWVARWPEHPKSAHAHWSFRKVGDTLPPPGNVSVMGAFERFGRAPKLLNEN